MQFETKYETEHEEDVRLETSKEADELGNSPYEAQVDTAFQSASHAAIEHSLTLRQALKIYPKAIGWSVAISLAVIMESYDLQIISSFFAYPEFQKKFGVKAGHGYVIPAEWQVALGTGSTIGMIIGIALGGFLVDRFGHKRVVLAGLVFNIGTIFITFFAPSVHVLLVGEILSGLPWGMFSTAAPGYAAETCPMILRGYMTIWVNLCWVIGHIIAAGLLRGLINVSGQWSYRIPFAVQWVFPVPLLIIVSLAPNSPWWLVRKGRLEEAERNFARTVSASYLASNAGTTIARTPTIDPAHAIANMIETTRLESELRIGASYGALFSGTNRRRTEIATVAWVSQALVGFGIQGYNVYFFTRAGLPASQAYALGLGAFCIAFVGTATSWILISYLGRRTIYIGGLIFMIPIMSLIGFLDLAPVTPGIKWGQAGLLLTWFATYGLSIGPIPYVIAAETGATRLRMKTIAFARAVYYVVAVLNTVLAPYMFTQTAWNLRGKAAFPAAAFQLILLVWSFFRLPECKGRTYEELDIMFAKKLPARAFKGYKFIREDIDMIHAQVEAEKESR